MHDLASSLVAAARAYRGVRFMHQGRSKQGLDCLGLLLLAGETVGLQLHDQPIMALDDTAYGARPDSRYLQQRLSEYLCSTTMPTVGDIALLSIDAAPQHLAIISDYPSANELGMIHAYAPARKVVEHRYDEHWRAATHVIYRLPVAIRTHNAPQPLQNI